MVSCRLWTSIAVVCNESPRSVAGTKKNNRVRPHQESFNSFTKDPSHNEQRIYTRSAFTMRSAFTRAYLLGVIIVHKGVDSQNDGNDRRAFLGGAFRVVQGSISHIISVRIILTHTKTNTQCTVLPCTS